MINHTETPRPSSWYSLSGPERDVVIVSQVNLNRNLADFPFNHTIDDDGAFRLRKTVETVFAALDGEYTFLDGAGMSNSLRVFYEDRGILTPGDHPGASIVGPADEIVVRLRTADHVRISAFAGGFNLAAAADKARALDTELEEHLSYAVSLTLGYLSPDIKRTGTGLTTTVLLHLPALEHSEGLKLPDEPSDERIVLNRFGSTESASGSLYTAGCFAFFGETEEEPIGMLAGFTERLVHYEREARQELVRRYGDELADTTSRALGTLRHARRLSVDETMDLLSVLRLGVSLGMIEDVDLADVTDLLFLSKDSQVRTLEQLEDNASIDAARANLARKILGRMKNV